MLLPRTTLAFLLALLSAAWLAAAAGIPVTEQFHIDPQTSASSCFVACHKEAVSIINLPGIPTNFALAITLNCRYQEWISYVAGCLPVKCASAPDLTFAVVYGRHFCQRAGVPGVDFAMPAWFLESPGGKYFECVEDEGEDGDDDDTAQPRLTDSESMAAMSAGATAVVLPPAALLFSLGAAQALLHRAGL